MSMCPSRNMWIQWESLRRIWENVSCICEDNYIDYVGMKEKKYIKKDPATFRSGNIVEMGFALVAFRQSIRGESDKHVCKPVLQTLALLDTLLTKDAFKSRVEAAVGVPVDAPATPKIPSTKQHAFIKVDSDEDDHGRRLNIPHGAGGMPCRKERAKDSTPSKYPEATSAEESEED
ncbi:hypothetical protein FB451DRAFT_1167173 [Mycena latifolia]|nr:hypothetical protein FB451DRAFT_1167173 [Mycena latifolia]